MHIIREILYDFDTKLLLLCVKYIISFYFPSAATVGHGKSEGDRVHINTFNTYVNDVMQHVNSVKQKHPGLPCFVIGHSLVSSFYCCVI